jgi:hypothetical protein
MVRGKVRALREISPPESSIIVSYATGFGEWILGNLTAPGAANAHPPLLPRDELRNCNGHLRNKQRCRKMFSLGR